MVHKHYLIFLLFFTLLASPALAVSSVDFPSAVFAGQNFRLLGSDMNCEGSSGDTCEIRYTSPDGTDDDVKVEDAPNPDPDSNNNARWYTFHVPGTYVIEMFECPSTVCPATPVDNDTVEVVDASAVGTVSTEFFYDVGGDTLSVQGFAPADAASTTVSFVGEASTESTCVPVTQNDNPEFTTDFAPVADTWAEELFFLQATFHNDTNCTGTPVLPTAFGGEFDFLQVQALLAALADLEALLNETNATLEAKLSDLDDDVIQNSAEIQAILGNLTLIFTELTDLQDDITTLELTDADLQDQIDDIQDEISDLLDDIDDLAFAIEQLEDDVSAEFFYDQDADVMSVQGFAPNEAVSAHVMFSGATATESACVLVDQDVSTEFTAEFTPVEGVWEDESFSLRVKFYNDTSCTSCAVVTPTTVWTEDFSSNSDWTGFTASGEGISYRENDATRCVNDANDDCLNADASEAASSTNFLDKDSDLDLSSCADGTAALDIDHVEEAGTLESTDCLYVWFSDDSGATWADRTEIFCNDNPAAIFSTTIPDKYLVHSARLRVESQNFGGFGEDAWLDDFSISCDFVLSDSCEVQPRAFGGEFNFLYLQHLQDLHDLLSEQLDALEVRVDEAEADITANADMIDEIKTNLTEVWVQINFIFSEIDRLDEADAELQDQIDELFEFLEALEIRVDELEVRLDVLEERFEQISDFGLHHDRVNQTLHVFGSGAPADAVWAHIVVHTVDGNFITFEDVLVDEDSTFGTVFDVSEWFEPGFEEGTNIDIRFYEDRTCDEDCMYFDHLLTIYDTWYGLLGELDYGFSHVNEKMYTGYYVTEPIERKIAYTIKPDVGGDAEILEKGGLYRIDLIQESADNGEDMTQTIEECIFLSADHRNELTSTISIPLPGEYKVYLSATSTPLCPLDDLLGGLLGGLLEEEVFESNEFPILFHDLKDSLPNASLTVISPEPNKEDVFWTRSDNAFTLVGAVLLNGLDFDTQSHPFCDIIDLTNNVRLRELLPVTEDEELVTCSGMHTLAGLDASNDNLDVEQVYTFQLELDAIGIDPTDSVMIGLDDTNPLVHEIFPGEEDAVSGTVLFTTNVSDATSGVAVVDILLVNKTNGNVVFASNELVFNETSGLWQIAVDTVELPDGAFDITVIATDFAGNSEELTIDPIIDNTDPVIEELFLPAAFLTGQENIITAHVTDNLAGVASVTAELQAFKCLDNNCVPCGQDVTLEATPGMDDSAFLCDEDTFDVPYELPVTDGMAHSGDRASFSFNDDDDTVTCIYESVESQEEFEGSYGESYNDFVGCWFNIDTLDPEEEPDAPYEPGEDDHFTTNFVSLHVGETEDNNVTVTLVLESRGDCDEECTDCEDEYTLTARQYDDFQSEEMDKLSFCENRMLELPATVSVDVTDDLVGVDYKAVFTFEDATADGDEVTCSYVPDESQELIEGDWIFDGCSGEQDVFVPLELEPGDVITTNSISLELGGEGESGSLTATMVLNNTETCEETLICDFVEVCQNVVPLNVPVQLVELELVEGDELDGTWEGDVGEFSDSFFDVFFDIEVTAEDDAENTHQTNAQSGVNVHEGFEIAITSVSPVPGTVGSALTVAGTLKRSLNDDEDVDGEQVSVNGVNTSVMSGLGWVTVVTPPAAGNFPIAAAHVSACGDIALASTFVPVNPAPVNLGGGGGGGGGGAGGGCSEGYTYQDGSCVKSGNTGLVIPPLPPEETDTGSSDAPPVESTSGNDAPPSNDVQTTPEDTNLLTGAVTAETPPGTNIRTVALWILLALIVLALFGYFFTKK